MTEKGWDKCGGASGKDDLHHCGAQNTVRRLMSEQEKKKLWSSGVHKKTHEERIFWEETSRLRGLIWNGFSYLPLLIVLIAFPPTHNTHVPPGAHILSQVIQTTKENQDTLIPCLPAGKENRIGLKYPSVIWNQ